jgi:hypothetical protein
VSWDLQFFDPITVASRKPLLTTQGSPLGTPEAGGGPMTQSVYNIMKAPLGWSIFCDGVNLGGVYGSKEAAFEAAIVAASFAVRDGTGIQINVPTTSETGEILGNRISTLGRSQ